MPPNGLGAISSFGLPLVRPAVGWSAVEVAALTVAVVLRDLSLQRLRIRTRTLHQGGRRNRQLYRMMVVSIHAPEMGLGDVEVIGGAARVWGARLSEFVADYSAADFQQLAESILARYGAAMPEAIRALPDGTCVHELKADGHRDRPTRCQRRTRFTAANTVWTTRSRALSEPIPV